MPADDRTAARSRSASSSPRSSARCAGPSSSTWRGRSRTSASTRIWLGDHLLYRYADGRRVARGRRGRSLAALAAVTSRVELGPLVACTTFHTPAMLAKLAATVDEISGGRLVLGLGAGWNETEFRAFGFPFDHRIARFEEAFTIIRTLLRDGAIDFDGRFFQARDCELLPRGPRPGGPPLMVGSIGPRMLEITLPHVEPGTSGSPTRTTRPPASRRSARPRRRGLPARSDATRRGRADARPSSSACAAAPVGCMGDTLDGAPAARGLSAEIAERLRAYAGARRRRGPAWSSTRSRIESIEALGAGARRSLDRGSVAVGSEPPR